MHISTFYSFKGGVGRTQALVNVGVELARRGKRVLLVDFDLEAPGIPTYPLLRPAQPTPGLVDFVLKYSSTGEAPDVREYCYECLAVGRNGGQLWVMPSGSQDDNYARRLSEIEWSTLYAERRGFLLFEDLKLQWKHSLSPDYVLVDSRTGHTDVSGICTRQLPDSVVIVFFPTDQNLQGLPKVVEDIRSEGTGPKDKNISLLFVVSNIPNLDDEDRILEDRLKMFAERLGYRALAATIHRYDSLALLNQVVFTADRPNSRLSREYQFLTNRLIEQNLKDRDGALAFIRNVSDPVGDNMTQSSATSVDDRLREIRKVHDSDPEVLEQLGALRTRQGRLEEADSLWNLLLDRGTATPRALLGRAESRVRNRDTTGALEDLEAVLKSEHARPPQIQRTVSLLASVAPERLRLVSQAPAVQRLDGEQMLSVALLLARHFSGFTSARDLLRQLLRMRIDESLRIVARHELALVNLGLGRADEAQESLTELVAQDGSIINVFNHAMADWACNGHPRKELFQQVLALDNHRDSANYAQCIAVALAVVGRTAEALDRVEEARQRVKAGREPEFSCWRYRITSSEEFLQDLDDIQRFAEGAATRPRFFGTEQST